MQEFIYFSEAKFKRFEDEQYAENMRTARICATFANTFRDTKKKKEPFIEDDFMPKKEQKKQEKKKPIDVNVMAEMFYALTEACGGVVDR
jgi:hypothetical protein